MERAVGGIGTALEPGERLFAAQVGETGSAAFALVVQGLVIPEIGLDPAKTPQEPIGGDEGGDAAALGGGRGLVELLVLGGEGGKFGGIFIREDFGFGADAGSESVQFRYGLAFSGAGSGRAARVAPVGFDLFLSGHSGS